MRLGIHLPLKGQDGDVLDAQGVASRARAIEDAGFDGIWIGDGLAAMARPDPLMWLLAGAVATKTIEVGTCIYQVPLRHPVELAQRLITLQALCRGRFAFGAGSGSGDRGFRAVGGDFSTRFAKLKHDLEVIKRLCNGEQVGDANLYPWPSTLGGPPIIIGAWSSPVWLRRAAQEYDGWMCSGSFHRSKDRGQETTFNSLSELIKRFRDLGGKRALISSIMVDITAPEANLADDEPFNLRCGLESAAERLGRLADMGYDDALLVTTAPGRALYEADPSAEELALLRSLVPRDGRRAYGTAAAAAAR
jgi:alkanesulfonate monooxygenase SsuD/methylene tetrahydromethanopterin reductase-like flavin-dependent oxidoreductase (luciferase family)